ncbi:MAG TPA: ATP-binding protein [Syntrophomonadaceae bacterium]|nr:ATP-binding protein [Syntrophomonadaceae bacterium]
MFRNKIAVKLSIYFALALLVLSIIIGSIFMLLFKNHTIELHKTDLEKRAVVIAESLSSFVGTDNKGGAGGSGGHGAYLRFINDIAMTDVWLVDLNRELMTRGPGKHGMEGNYNYADLPADADAVISEVFTGKTAFSEDFSSLLNVPTLTVGTPIYQNSQIVGVVLLHSPVNGINQAVFDGFSILAISILVALFIGSILAVCFSITFARPLKRLENTAMLLAQGDYTATTNIKQNDEIGDLATSMDILADQLDLASKKSENLEQLRRDFVANISHELRTPLTVIRGSLEALCDGVITEPKLVSQYHQQMLFETLFLDRLVGDLLDLSRLQNYDFAIDKELVNICDVIDDVSRSMENIANEKGIVIKVKKDRTLYQVSGDYGRLRQMLMIILDNAIKFSSSNGIVKISLENNILSIVDNGVGISPEDLPYIFERFYKFRSEKNKSGTGLGLAIAKQIADRHDFELTVASELGVKTEFRLQLN